MDEAQDEPIFIPVQRMCRQLGIGLSTGWQLVRNGDIPSARIGDRVLIPVAELRTWADSLVTRKDVA